MSQSLDLAVPSFSAHSVMDLTPALQELGLKDAFSSKVVEESVSTQHQPSG